MILKNRSFWLLIFLILIFSALFLFKVKNEMIDFEVNYRAGERIRADETLYRTEDGHFQFKYPPFSALIYLPLSYLPLVAAKSIWYLIILLSTGFILYFSKRLIISEPKVSSLLPVFTFLILARYFLREIQLGQINAVIIFILTIMVYLMISRENLSSSWREIVIGLLWGFSASLKPYAFIFFPYFLIKKKWQTLSSGILFLIMAFFTPALFYGIKGNVLVHMEWKSLLSQSTPILFNSQDNISIIAFFTKWTDSVNVSFCLYVTTVIFLAFFLLIIFFKGLKIPKSSLLDSSILLILIPLVSPLGWDYTLISSALGVMIILHNFFKYSKLWRSLLVINFFIIFFSLYDILGKKLYSSFMSWSIITINFLILVGYLSYLRLKKYC